MAKEAAVAVMIAGIGDLGKGADPAFSTRERTSSAVTGDVS